MRKKILSLALSASLVLGLMPTEAMEQRASASSGKEVAADARAADTGRKDGDDGGGITDSGSFGGTKDALGEVVQEDTHQWSFAQSTGILTITGDGAMPDYVSSPATAENYYQNAPWYQYAKEIKKVVFAGGVTSVGNYAFYKGYSDEDYASLEEADITGAENLRKVGDYAFGSCTAFAELKGMERLTDIGISSFGGTSLREASLPQVTDFTKNMAFYGCKSLKKIELPKLLKITGTNVFSGCTALEEVSFPELTEIGGNTTFQDCTSLRQIELPKLKKITGLSTFLRCSSVESIVLPELEFATKMSTFASMEKLKRVSLPKVKELGMSTFEKCYQLVDVEIPECCSIDNKAFNDCYNLIGLRLPSICQKYTNALGGTSTGTFGSSLFNNCYAMAFVDLPASVDYFSSVSLEGMPNLQRAYYRKTTGPTFSDEKYYRSKGATLYVKTGLKSAYEKVYKTGPIEEAEDLDALLAKENDLRIRCESVNVGQEVSPVVTDNAASPDDKATGVRFEYFQDNACTKPAVGEDAFTVPTVAGDYFVRGRTEDSDDYFGTTSNIVAFTIYGDMVYEGATLNNKTWKLTLTAGDMADYESAAAVPWHEYMDRIVYVAPGEGITLRKIGAHAFHGASALKAAELAAVEEIGTYALYGCRQLQEQVDWQGVSLGAYALYQCDQLSGKLAFGSGVTEVPEYCVYGTGISEIKLPDSVEIIGRYAFAANDSLPELVIPAKVTEIPENMVSYCDSLAKVTLPEGVTSIGSRAFATSAIQEVQLPESLESIGDSAFFATKKLLKLDIPANVTELGAEVFESSGIGAAIIPANVAKVGHSLFRDCENLEYAEFENGGYTGEDLMTYPYKDSVKVDGKNTQVTIDRMFSGSPNVWVVCDGTTYETLSGYQQVYDASIYGTEEEYEKHKNKGWRGVLHKPDEFGKLTEKVFADATALEEKNYDAALWTEFQKTLKEARALSEEGTTNYEKFVNCKTAGNRVKDGVFSFLKESFRKASKILEEDYDTEEDCWWDFLDAKDDADKMILSGELPEIEDSVRVDLRLKNAMESLVLRPTDEVEKLLNEILAEIGKLKEGDYTPKSWKELQEAVKAGEEIKSSGTYSQIQAARKRIEEARDALELLLIAPDTSAPDNSATPKPGNSATPKPGNSATPAPGNSGKVTVKRVSLKKVKSKKNKTLLVQWKKLSGVSGYQIQASTHKKFKKGVKKYTVAKAKVTKKTLRKLKRKKTYYVRIRAYRKVDGKKYYGMYSKVKKAKVR